MDGISALRLFKKQSNLPVIYLTARQRNVDEVIGLELGADDYIRKPFDVDVVLARVKKALRQAALSSQPEVDRQPLQVGDLMIEPLAHRVTLRGKLIELTPLEYEILHLLAQRRDEVVSVDELLRDIWGAEYLGQPQVVYVHMRGLREKIEIDPGQPQRVISVRGIGYMLVSGEKQA
jgi:DNA-binding response OmpR family regulator